MNKYVISYELSGLANCVFYNTLITSILKLFIIVISLSLIISSHKLNYFLLH